MKTIIMLLSLATFCASAYSQNAKPSKGTSSTKRKVQAKPATPAPIPASTNTAPAQMRETATDRYLKGPTRASTATNATSSTTATTDGGNSPFATGIHPADNAAKTFDTARANSNTINRNTSGANVAGRTDTAFNVNTINNGGVTTNSGAVDRSGNAQFGQTNWGDSRSTVGESQWTIPPPITASFSKEFPAANNASWTRNNVDTSVFSARYKSGVTWVTTNYNAAGERLDMRTEVPMVQPPRPVSVYLAKQPGTFHVVTINKLQVQGKAEVYEILTQTGKKIYINNDGTEVDY